MNFNKLLIIIIFFISCKSATQKMSEIVQIRDVKIYLDFKEKGYSTAGAFTHFNELNNQNNKSIKLSESDKNMMQSIMNIAEISKSRQTKHGGNLIFCEIKFSNSNTYNKFIIAELGISYDFFGNKKEESIFIIDLTSMINYKVTNPSNLKWLKEYKNTMRLIPDYYDITK